MSWKFQVVPGRALPASGGRASSSSRNAVPSELVTTTGGMRASGVARHRTPSPKGVCACCAASRNTPDLPAGHPAATRVRSSAATTVLPKARIVAAQGSPALENRERNTGAALQRVQCLLRVGVVARSLQTPRALERTRELLETGQDRGRVRLERARGFEIGRVLLGQCLQVAALRLDAVFFDYA